MLKKYASLILVGLIINLFFSSFAFAQDTETRATEKIKIKIAKVDIGGKTIEVKLKDKTKVKGYITEIKDDQFVLVSKKNGASTNISYDQAQKVNIPLTTLQKVGIGVAIAGLAIVVYGVVGTICVLSRGSCGGVVD